MTQPRQLVSHARSIYCDNITVLRRPIKIRVERAGIKHRGEQEQANPGSDVCR